MTATEVVTLTDIYKMILDELSNRKCAHVQIFPPVYICSIGTHVFNLYNKTTKIYTESSRIPDTRLHIMFVAPPGFSKTFWLEQFLRGDQAILLNSSVDIGFRGAMTEAGFVGTVKFENGGGVAATPGMARTCINAIVGFEEFSAVTEMMRSQHSRMLDTALLGALDSGWVYKQLGAGAIEYQTYVTLWTATQGARFDLSSGLGRRFLFVQFSPTEQDKSLLTKIRRASKNVRFNPRETQTIREVIKQMRISISDIETVEFDKDVFRLFDDYGLMHYEEPLYERILLGYTIMRGRCDRHTTIKLDNESEKIIERAFRWRGDIRRGSEFSEILTILREHGGEMKLFTLKDKLLAFGRDWTQSTELLGGLARIRAITIVGDTVKIKRELMEETRNAR